MGRVFSGPEPRIDENLPDPQKSKPGGSGLDPIGYRRKTNLSESSPMFGPAHNPGGIGGPGFVCLRGVLGAASVVSPESPTY